MQLIADLQIHSKYSQAVSKYMDLSEIEKWAIKKGIQIVTTGDWQHPLYFQEITATLSEASPGLYKLRKSTSDIRFLLSTEISSIYSQDNKLRRVHNLIFSPSLEICQKVITALLQKGAKLESDGRPIIGLSSKNLLDLVLSISPDILLIPAHIWTPWFSVFGSKSGFNSLENCFGELSKHIYAVETGLSSDPQMNWQISELNDRTIVSFSDAHSGPKMGREATVFETDQATINDISYYDLLHCLRKDQPSKLKLSSTIEFFPEEGKYHWSGHRACNIRYSPTEIQQKGSLCPVCHKPLTVGVANRILDLSDQPLNPHEITTAPDEQAVTYISYPNRIPFTSMIPLQEILQEVLNSKTKATREYERLTTEFAPEFEVLLQKSLTDIQQAGGERLAEAIQKVRTRDVFIDPGYDGVFGTIKIWQNT